MEDQPLHIWPEFLEGVAAHVAQKSVESTQGRVLSISFAVGAPCVGKEVSSGNSDESRIGRSIVAVRTWRGECRFHHISDALFYGHAFGRIVFRIFPPESAEACFHCIAG